MIPRLVNTILIDVNTRFVKGKQCLQIFLTHYLVCNFSTNIQGSLVMFMPGDVWYTDYAHEKIAYLHIICEYRL